MHRPLYVPPYSGGRCPPTLRRHFQQRHPTARLIACLRTTLGYRSVLYGHCRAMRRTSANSNLRKKRRRSFSFGASPNILRSGKLATQLFNFYDCSVNPLYVQQRRSLFWRVAFPSNWSRQLFRSSTISFIFPSPDRCHNRRLALYRCSCKSAGPRQARSQCLVCPRGGSVNSAFPQPRARGRARPVAVSDCKARSSSPTVQFKVVGASGGTIAFTGVSACLATATVQRIALL